MNRKVDLHIRYDIDDSYDGNDSNDGNDNYDVDDTNDEVAGGAGTLPAGSSRYACCDDNRRQPIKIGKTMPSNKPGRQPRSKNRGVNLVYRKTEESTSLKNQPRNAHPPRRSGWELCWSSRLQC